MFEEEKNRGSVTHTIMIAMTVMVVVVVGAWAEYYRSAAKLDGLKEDLQSIAIPAPANANYRTIPAPAGLSLYEVDMPNGDVCRIVQRAKNYDPAIHCKGK